MQAADTEAARKPAVDRDADSDTRAVPAGAAVYIGAVAGVEAEVAPAVRAVPESVWVSAEGVAVAVSAPVRVAEVPVS